MADDVMRARAQAVAGLLHLLGNGPEIGRSKKDRASECLRLAQEIALAFADDDDAVAREARDLIKVLIWLLQLEGVL